MMGERSEQELMEENLKGSRDIVKKLNMECVQSYGGKGCEQVGGKTGGEEGTWRRMEDRTHPDF